MPRYFLELSYKGTAYHGWQTQPNATSVQQTIEDRLSALLRRRTPIVGAGRTDTGVHASYYVAHFDTDTAIDDSLFYKLNCALPTDIAVHRITEVDPSCHARFGATRREYKYYISTAKNAFNRDFTLTVTIPLNIEAMNEAADKLLDMSDFITFSKMHSGNKTNICHIFEAHWEERGEILIFTIAADRFLRNMVRSIVGTLYDVGRGKISVDQFVAIAESRDRSRASGGAVAAGLFMTDIEYDTPDLAVRDFGKPF